MASTNRRSEHIPEGKLKRGPNGWKLCRWCSTEVKPPRRTFCSDECVSDYRLRSDPTYLRWRVEKRDHGICALCGIDTVRIQTGLQELSHLVEYDHVDKGGRPVVEKLKAPLDLLKQFLGIGKWDNRQSLWDADHIREVVTGGGECGLENMQTLCVWCHRAKTSGLAARLAEERRLAKEKAAGIQRLEA